MKKDEVIRIAHEAGLLPNPEVYVDDLERFAVLVADAEREACAQVCEQMPELKHGWRVTLPSDCAAAIRARGKL